MRIKIFENFDSNELLLNVKECFQELVDDGISECHLNTDDENIVIVYNCFDSINASGNFDDLYSEKEKEFSIYNRIYKTLKKLESLHNTEIQYDYDATENSDGSISIDLYIREGILKKGEFWQLTPFDVIKFNYKSLIKILELPPNVKISTSTTGIQSMMIFSFINADSLESNKESLIENFNKLSIDGVKLNAPFNWSTNEPEVPFKIYKIASHNSYRGRVEAVNNISFGLNKDMKYCW